MDLAGNEFARLALMQAWQLTALIVCVLIASRIVARERPHLAYMLWLVVLIKCVTPPLWSSPSSVFTWLESARHSEANQVGWHAEGGWPSLASRDAALELGDGAERTGPPSMAAVELTDAEALSWEQLVRRRNGLSFASAFGWIWAIGVAAALLLNGVRWAGCVWRLRHWPSIEMPDLQRRLQTLARRLHVRRRVRLIITTSRIGPAVIGILRPVIVLPEIIVRGRQPDDLEAILAHELIHVRRGDLWLGLLQVSAQALWWFHPLVFWTTRMSTREAERCCDEEVIGELGCDPRHYARSLLDVLELKRSLQTVPAFPGMKPVEVTSQRLERIMKLGQGCHKQTPKWCWGALLILLTASLPGASFMAAAEDEAKDAAARSNGPRPTVDSATPTAAIDADRAADAPQTGGKTAGGTTPDRTYRAAFGAGVRSDAGLLGALTVDEREFVPLNADANAKADPAGGIRERLKKTCELHFTGTPFREIVAHLETGSGQKLHIDEAGLATAGMTARTHVTFDTETPVTVSEVLDQLLKPLGLCYVVDRGRVIITGEDAVPVYTAVYNVADLLQTDLTAIAPQRLARRQFASPADRRFEILATLIKQNVDAGSWSDRDGRGVIEPFPTNLSFVISQTATAHAKVVTLLNALRTKLGLEVAAVVPEQPFEQWDRDARVIAKVYPVADLVIPIPGPRVVKVGQPGQQEAEPAAPDYDTLIELVTSTIAPHSWRRSGGRGELAPFPANLSSVIRQTEEVHVQIADLLEQLRRLQDLQVTIETRYVRLPGAVSAELKEGSPATTARPSAEGWELLKEQAQVVLPRRKAAELLATIEAAETTNVRAAPKLTIFNGQVASVSFSGDDDRKRETFNFQAVCSEDHRAVRLSFALGANPEKRTWVTHKIRSGDSLVIDVSACAEPPATESSQLGGGFGFLRNIPYIGPAFEESRPPANTTLLLVITPRVIFQQQEVVLDEADASAPDVPADIK